MNRSGKIAVCRVVGLASNINLHADDAVLDNPYALIVARNIFGLNPPPPPTQAPTAEPPAKITPNGIMSIFGNLQVLFKVAGTAKPGQPPGKDQSYILSVGQRQDDIEVTRIDEKNNLVTFNNHGLVQELPLANAPALTTAAPPSGAPGAPMQNSPAPGIVPPNSNNGGLGNRGGSFGGRNGGSGNNSGADSGSNLRNVPTRNNTFNAASQIPEGMTPEIQTIAIEANRALGGENAKILPITELTPPQGSENGN